MKITNIDATIAGPDVVKQNVTFKCLTRNSASDIQFSDNATNVTSEFGIETDDQRVAVIYS